MSVSLSSEATLRRNSPDTPRVARACRGVASPTSGAQRRVAERGSSGTRPDGPEPMTVHRVGSRARLGCRRGRPGRNCEAPAMLPPLLTSERPRLPALDNCSARLCCLLRLLACFGRSAHPARAQPRLHPLRRDIRPQHHRQPRQHPLLTSRAVT